MQYKALRRCQRFKRLQGAVRSTPGGQSCSPWAGPRPGGPERRAQAAEQGQTGTQPALPPRPSRPARGRKGASRRSAGGARVRLLRISPGRPRTPSLLSRPGRWLRNLHRPDRLLAVRPNPAGPALPPPELGPHRPLLDPPTGTSCAARSPACGEGGSCAEERAPIAQINRGRSSEQDGAPLLVSKSGGGTLRLTKLVHWSEARRAEPHTLARRARSRGGVAVPHACG